MTHGHDATGVGSVEQADDGLEAAFEPLLDVVEPASRLAVPEDLVERYRDLASRLLFACGDEPHVSLAVTSAVSGEGVTTSCVAAALALARSTAKRILLLDANLRRPALHTLLDVPCAPGLYHMIQAGAARFLAPGRSTFMHETPIENLWLTPSGGRLDDPTQLLTSEAARDALQTLFGGFDYILVDCPPVLTSVDAAAICRLTTRTAIVVRAELTPRDAAARACARLQDARLMGVLLNGVEG